MFRVLFKNRLSYFFLIYFLLLLFWWIRINSLGLRETNENYLFGVAYAFIALVGGLNGLFIAKIWGGFRSSFGRGVALLSLGLLGLCFGQLVWSYYNLVANIEVPYPSIADVGYFSIIPLYAVAVLYFGKAIGAKYTLMQPGKILAAILIPAIMVGMSYFLFLKNLQPDYSNAVKTFLDFGYPFGEAITISIALVTFELSRGVLGGKMRSRMLFLIVALVVQYLTDYYFTYNSTAGSYYNAGPVDLMYTVSFTIMSLALIYVKNYDS